MKTTIPCLLALLVGVFLCSLSCTSPAQQTAAQALAETVTAATKDGIVTESEAKDIEAHMKAYVDAPGVDWAQLGGSVLASIAVGFLGLRYLPNSQVVGKDEAAALAALLPKTPSG
jgi:hypothetical protein